MKIQLSSKDTLHAFRPDSSCTDMRRCSKYCTMLSGTASAVHIIISIQRGFRKRMKERKYIAIDLKSFYASVECADRGLDPLTTNLVVADPGRTEKTICLAVSPSLKQYGIPGRARLFEVVQKVREINAVRKARAGKLTGSSKNDIDLKQDPSLALDYYIAPPRMRLYIDVSSKIYQIYLNYVSQKDIHVYSIDEVFIDVTDYLDLYGKPVRDLAEAMILDVLKETGITATAGIGPNLYLSKVAMDIDAKHTIPDKNGVRISELNEKTYRERLWTHRPLTDFWRVGRGYSEKLEAHGLYTMGDIARCSLENEDLLYKLFGVNAELLIDHAWGWEPCTMEDIKAYVPDSRSTGSGQVLHMPYDWNKTAIVVREMAESLSMDLLRKNKVTDQLILTIGYDIQNLKEESARNRYNGEIKTDYYGRAVPKHAAGTINLKKRTSSADQITEAVMALYGEIVNKDLLIRRIYLTASHVYERDEQTAVQLDLFSDPIPDNKAEENEEFRQKAVLEIQDRFGKNAVFKGTDLKEGATTIDRNNQIGGHKA